MVEFSFYLSESDYDRLYEIKEHEGKEDMTGNEFARELLEQEISRRYWKMKQKN